MMANGYQIDMSKGKIIQFAFSSRFLSFRYPFAIRSGFSPLAGIGQNIYGKDNLLPNI